MKYQELEQLLYTLIFEGKIGDTEGRLPGERQLSEQFGVSRTTVRKAIAALQKQGCLITSHGKGTFIKKRTATLPITSVFQWHKNSKDLGMHPSTKILEQKIISATKEISDNLAIHPGDPVLMLDKLFYWERIPSSESISFFPVDLFPKIDYVDFTLDSTTVVLQMQYNIQSKRTMNSIEAILPPSQVAKQLKISAETPVLFFDSVMYGSLGGKELPMEYFRSYFRTDQLRFGFALEHDQSY